MPLESRVALGEQQAVLLDFVEQQFDQRMRSDARVFDPGLQCRKVFAERDAPEAPVVAASAAEAERDRLAHAHPADAGARRGVLKR